MDNQHKHDQALIEALETIASGNTDPDLMVEIARAALADIYGAAHE